MGIPAPKRSDRPRRVPAPQWRRTIAVTAKRTAVAAAALVLTIALGAALAHIVVFASGRATWAGDVWLLAGWLGLVVAPYLVAVYWWLDHLLAPTGRAESMWWHVLALALLVAIAVVTFVAVVRPWPDDVSMTSADVTMFFALTLTLVLLAGLVLAIATSVAGVIPGSFPPRGYGVSPWAQPRGT